MAFVKGQPHPGRRFQKGQSGNPSGMSKSHAQIQALARTHCPDAIRRIAEIMRTSDDPRAVIAAAQRLLERGYGKAPQILAGDSDGGAIRHALEVTFRAPGGIS